MSILHQIPSEAKIKREIKRIVFGKHLFCPYCGHYRVKKYDGRYRCKRCRRPFSLISVTWLKGMKLSLKTFWLLLWCWQKKIAVDQAQKLCGVSEVTVRRWYERFRDHLPQEKLINTRLSGQVQMDEAYRKVRKKDKAYSIIAAKEKAKKDKAKKNKERKIALQFLPKNSVDRGEAINFLSQYVEPDSDLFTDGAGIYRKIENWWRVNHQYERHNKWEFSLTSEIEGLLGNLFTFIRRMYHHVTREKLPGILKEFWLRFTSPEYFESPSRYLEVALVPIRQTEIVSWRKFMKKFQLPGEAEFPFIFWQKSLTSVPS